MDVLLEYNIVGYAIGTIFALLATQFFKSFVDNIFMPIVTNIFYEKGWNNFSVKIGGMDLKVGIFISTFIYVLMMLFLLFLVLKYLVPSNKKEKKCVCKTGKHETFFNAQKMECECD